MVADCLYRVWWATNEVNMRHWPLHTKIFVGMVLGLLVGLGLNAAGVSLDGPLGDANAFVGDLFLRGLRFIAVPVVLFSLIAGAGSLNDVTKLARIGGRTVVIYLFTTALAISTGLIFANVIRPGTFLPEGLRDGLAAEGADLAVSKMEGAAAPSVWDTLLNIVPENPFMAVAEGNMLQVVFFALAFGMALTLLPEERSKPILALADTANEAIIKLVHVLMGMAPVAVFCLLVSVMADLGLQALGALVVYGVTVVAGLAVMMFGVYPLALRVVAGIGPRRFFSGIAPAQVLAFSSSSSSATLPVTLECVQNNLGVDDEVASFVVPLGATINMDGTALYQGVAALFIAQLYGVDLTLMDQLTIVLTATLASIGTAGVPGVGIVMLIIVLQSVGMSPEVMQGGIAIIFGVDRILDMCRTTCNVTGDAMVACVVAHAEGALATPEQVAANQRSAAARPLDENP